MWGDDIKAGRLHTDVTAAFFSWGWALQLVAGMLWAAKFERRWTLHVGYVCCNPCLHAGERAWEPPHQLSFLFLLKTNMISWDKGFESYRQASDFSQLY